MFTQGGDAVDFHANPGLDTGDVADVLATVKAHVTRLLAQRGEDADDAGGGTVDPCAENAPALGAWRRRRFTGALRSDPGPAPASSRPATHWRLPRCLRGRGGVTRTTTASTSTPNCACPQTGGTAWNDSAGMSCGPRWRRSAST